MQSFKRNTITAYISNFAVEFDSNPQSIALGKFQNRTMSYALSVKSVVFLPFIKI